MGQVFSQVADKVFFILLVTLVANLSRENSVMSIALVAYTIPSVFFGALAGVFVDRWDKKRTMIATNLLRAGLIVLTTWFGHNLFVLVPLAFMVSTISQPFTPAESSTIPLVVTREQLLTANSLFATTVMASIIVGFTLGEPLIDLAGIHWAPALTAGLYLVSTLSLLLVRYVQPQVRERKGLKAIIGELAEGYHCIRELRAVRLAIWRLVVLFAMFSGLSLLTILFAKTQLHTNFTWILAVAGLGLASGAAIIGRFGHDWPKDDTVVAGFLLSGVSLVVLAVFGAHSLTLAYVLSALVGFSSAFVVIPMQTVLQETTPEAVRGKVFGAQNMAVNVATTLPMAFTGPLADLIGFRTVFVLMGGAMMAAAGAIRLSPRAQIGRLAPPIPPLEPPRSERSLIRPTKEPS